MRAATTAVIVALALSAPAQAQDRFNAIWGLSSTDVWAVGGQGIAAHFNGQGWVSMSTGATSDLRAVWASGPRDVWAVGDDGTILRMTGSAWTWVRPLVHRDFVAVGGCAANDVWVVGQSGDMNQPPVILHFDGTNWTLERAPFAFRAASMALACASVSGSGGGGPIIAGAAYFDPSPAQRRDIGVLMRRSGQSWTTQGFDGRAMTDPQIGGASWTSVASCGGATLLAGRNSQGQVVVLLSRGNAWSPLAPPTVANVEPGDFRFTVACDGTTLALFPTGFARYVNNRWAVVTADVTAGQPSAADQAEYAQLAQTFAAAAQRGQQLTAEQLQRFQALTEQVMAASTNMASAAARAATLAFGDDLAVWAPTAANFFVASRNRAVMHVTGDNSEVVWSSLCGMAQLAVLEPCSNHGARQAVPSSVTGPKPAAPPEAAAPQQAPRPSGLPSVPSVPRPRVPRP